MLQESLSVSLPLLIDGFDGLRRHLTFILANTSETPQTHVYFSQIEEWTVFNIGLKNTYIIK